MKTYIKCGHLLCSRLFPFLMLLLLEIVAGGCRKHRGEPEDPTEELMEVNIASHFRDNDVVLRAELSEAEKKLLTNPLIYNFRGMRVVFYAVNEQGAPTTVKYAFDLDVQMSKRVVSGTDYTHYDDKGTLELAPLRVAPADYKVLVIANPNNEIRSRTEPDAEFATLRQPMKVSYDRGRDKNGKKNPDRYANFFFYNPELLSISPKSLNPKGDFNVNLSMNHALVTLNLEHKSSLQGVHIDEKSVTIFPDKVSSQFCLFPEKDSIKVLDGRQEFFPLNPRNQVVDYAAELDSVAGIDVVKSYNFPFLRVPENAPLGGDKSGKNISRVIVRLTMSPNAEIKLGESWIRYNGKAYSLKGFKAELENAKKDKNQAKIKELQGYIGKFFKKGEEDIEAVKPGYQDDVLRYYHGQGYYVIPIRHLSADVVGGSHATGRFGVIRGSIYLLNIVSVNGFGYATARAIPQEIDYEDTHVSGSLIFGTPKINSSDHDLF